MDFTFPFFSPRIEQGTPFELEEQLQQTITIQYGETGQQKLLNTTMIAVSCYANHKQQAVPLGIIAAAVVVASVAG